MLLIKLFRIRQVTVPQSNTTDRGFVTKIRNNNNLINEIFLNLLSIDSPKSLARKHFVDIVMAPVCHSSKRRRQDFVCLFTITHNRLNRRHCFCLSSLKATRGLACRYFDQSDIRISIGNRSIDIDTRSAVSVSCIKSRANRVKTIRTTRHHQYPIDQMLCISSIYQ